MEESQQPISTQQDREADHAPVTFQPASATTHAQDGNQTDDMEHLTVISDNVESKYTRPVKNNPWQEVTKYFYLSSLVYLITLVPLPVQINKTQGSNK